MDKQSLRLLQSHRHLYVLRKVDGHHAADNDSPGLVTWCCPCVTFGRTHHRLHKSGSLEGYHFVNASCILSCVSGILPCLPLAMLTIQRADVRKKYNLEGSCLTDMAINCCCGVCSLVQQDKEAEHWETQGAGKTEQYQVGDTMTYGPQ